MRRIILLIAVFCVFCLGVLNAQTPVKGLTVTGAFDTIRKVETNPRFISPTGELYKRPVISISGQLLNASINITDNTITSCSTLAMCATLTATVSGSGDYLIPISERGVCFSTTVNPTLLSGIKIADANMSSDGTGSFEILMTGLEPITTYHARAYVVCLDDTVYSSDMSFSTPKSYCHSITLANETSDATGVYAVSDHEGNSYSVVQLGSQCWLRENLRTTTSPSTGNSIVVTSPNRSFNQKAAYWYNDDATTYSHSKYGLLYNWFAAVDTFDNNGTIEEVATTVGEVLTWSPTLNVNAAGHRRGICPAGWHIPSREEWEMLVNYVKSQSIYQCDHIENNIAKSLSATTGWNSATGDCNIGNNLNANNTTGFNALPTGVYTPSGFEKISTATGFWTTKQNGGYSYISSFTNNESTISLVISSKPSGQSVRCVRDVITTLDLSTVTENTTVPDGCTVTGTLGSNVKISIADGATVTLDNVNINSSGTWTSGDYAGITCEGDATIVLSGTNSVRGFSKYYPGIQAGPSDKTLTILGNGSLNASSNGFATGIGCCYGNSRGDCGNIVITGGTITATGGGDYAAGIGAGFSSICGNITINGGTINATSGTDGLAAVGKGYTEATCGDITISGTPSVTLNNPKNTEYPVNIKTFLNTGNTIYFDCSGIQPVANLVFSSNTFDNEPFHCGTCKFGCTSPSQFKYAPVSE